MPADWRLPDDTAAAGYRRSPLGDPQDERAGCAFCGALNRLPRLHRQVAPAHQRMRCWRCDSALEDMDANDDDRLPRQVAMATALALTACVALVGAHLWPMLSLSLQGQGSSVTLAGASSVLWSHGHSALATALFVTTVAAPMAELALMLMVMRSMRQALTDGRALACTPWRLTLVHAWQSARTWNMTEIFILGTAVALVKLGEMATLLIGPASMALLAFMVLRLLAVRSLSVPQAWSVLGKGCLDAAVGAAAVGTPGRPLRSA